ncbi:LysR family transcriptional regulator [Candidatus Sororendozoicomonas aggregata]|uniref:LysR family transcriptional regulator n=1 Tax=Candidatus Sororendozoicomonas aggregata TaxID=3073239 RepID=UPI002ED0987C
MAERTLGIELRHLRTLEALKDTGSLVQASRLLHTTQSALSHQLKELEQRIGIELFVRKSRPLLFTTAGLRLLALAEQVLPQFKAAEYALTQLAGGDTGRLHIAIECHSCYQWLMPTIDAYRADWPEVEMDFSAGFNFAPLPALARGELDLVVTSDPVDIPGLVFLPLFEYEMRLAVSKQHPLRAQSFVVPEDLVDETLITYPVPQERLDVFRCFLDPAGVEPMEIRTSELTLMILQLVASQRGVSTLPNWVLAEFLTKDQIATLTLGEKGLWSTLYAAVRVEQVTLPYMSAFISTAKDTCFSTLEGVVASDPLP